MNSISTKHVIEKQLPSHIRESNPVLNKFLEYYYEFQTESKIPDIIQEVKKYNDIDETDEKFLTDFFEEFKLLPVDIVSNKRLVAKHIYDLYKSKGSETSLRLLFKIVYGEEIDIQYPSEDILRASDGVWVQNNVVSLSKVEGEIKTTSNRILFETTKGVYDFNIEKSESFSSNIVRIFFRPSRNYFLDAGQIVRVYTNNTLDFIGNLIPTPSYIEVIDGGAFWQLGQLIVLPGEVDTICQITRVGENSSIKKLDIIQYGSASENSIHTISPFLYVPREEYSEYYKETITQYPTSSKHTLDIFNRNIIQENIVGETAQSSFYQTSTDTNSNTKSFEIVATIDESPYIIEGYVLNNFTIDSTIVNRVQYSANIVNDDITLSQWLTSKARLKLKTSLYTKTAGFYADGKGQLSSSNIRLQDNFFYQLFSYVVNTSRVLSNIKNVISLVHPAGFKYFINTKREYKIDVNVQTARILSQENIFLNSATETQESILFERKIQVNDYIQPTTINNTSRYDQNNFIVSYTNNENNWDGISESIDGYDQYTQEADSIAITKQ